MRTFVAVGDSFTEGLQDEQGPDRRHRGWADRVAAALAEREGGIRYANLAVRGRLLGEVVAEQVPVARRLEPDLVSFQAGGNDILRPRADLPAILDRYDRAVAGLPGRAILFTVVLRTGGGRTAGRLAARFAEYNSGVRATAQRHGATVVDLAEVAVMRDPRVWHEDRLHLAPEGHARIAAAVLEAIGGPVDDWWRTELPGSPRATRRAALAEEARWVRVHLLPWVARRIRGVSSGDGISPKHVDLVDVLPAAD